MRKIFETNQTSSNGLHRVVTLWGEKYDGISTNIQSGSGFNHIVKDDWTDFLQVGQEVRLIKLDNSEITAEVTSFNYSSSTNTTSIGLDVTFDADYVIIKSNDFFPIFNPIINALDTTWDGEGDDILAPIKSSYTDIKYMNRDAWFDRFIDLFLSGEEDDFKLTIHIGGTILEWCGNIVMDLLQWENQPKPRAYHFKATDGVDRLKGITYDRVAKSLQNWNVPASPYTLIDHIMTCFEANGLSQFWDANDIYIYESCEYFSSLVSSPYDDKSIFAYSYLTNSIFYERGSTDPVRYKTCYEVLEDICRLFSLRLVFSRGAYYFQQVRNFRQDPQIESRAFKKDKTYTKVDYNFKFPVFRAADGDSSKIRVMGSGMYGYFAGLAEARIDYYRHFTLNLQYKRNFSGSGPMEVEIGDIDAGVGLGRSVNIQYLILTPNADARVTIRLWIEDANGDITHNLINNTNRTTLWRTATSTTDKGGSLHIHFRNPVGQIYRFETPEVPASGKLRMEIQFNTTFGSPVLDWLEIRVPTLNNLPETNVIIAENYIETFSKILNIDPLILTENNTSTSTNTIQVNTDYPSGGLNTLVEAGDEWVMVDGAFSKSDILSAHKAREAMMLQYKPVGKYMGTFCGTFFAHQALIYDDVIWVMNGMSLNYMMDEVSGEWFEIISTNSEIKDEVENPKDIPIDPRQGGGMGEFAMPQDDSRNIIDGLGKNLATTATLIGTFDAVSEKYKSDKFTTENEAVERLKAGDIVTFINEFDNTKISDIEVVGVTDLGGGIFEVEYDEILTDAPISRGTKIVINEDKNIVTENEVRAKNIVTSDDLTTTQMENLKSGSIQINGTKLYFRSGGTLYEIQGTPTV